ncbi:phosphoglycerate mutase [candidate division MSBL1 archaeon SCGC-AAA382C18]|uniref:phosphoglycerate mutase (2,3-diphosphoglycerate-independent) n=1 Tax=candidate division MSBL1 archaeon SCGC-AAA382C18 TaxID=1698281 RepID=A0A133VJE9_9EURY|nr:phosphoglycerate mutase [candidate division MSBL1 archaeon SCGC-AAA382C18]
MKHVIVIGDGMADYPLEEINGKTPLQVAEKPNMDWIASRGESGLLRTVPKGMQASSDVAIMSILGYNPTKFHTGRGPIEAAGMGIELEEDEMAFRCNLISQKEGVMRDYSAGHITTEEAEKLIETMDKKYRDLGNFYVGTEYRHLFVTKHLNDEINNIQTRPPHDMINERLKDNIIEPKDHKYVQALNEMILKSTNILSNHPVNLRRKKETKRPANGVWIWGQGKKTTLEPKFDEYGISGAVISEVPLVKGLGVLAGLNKFETYQDTKFSNLNYEEKAKLGLAKIKDYDFLIIHDELPDEKSHAGDIEKKIDAIEKVDYLVGKIIQGLRGKKFTISILPDHPTPIEVKNHTAEPVPFSIYSTEGRRDKVEEFDEYSARRGSMGKLKGNEFINKFLSL